MVKFQDEALFVKGTCNFTLSDPVTGDIKYQDSKFDKNNITTGASVEPIKGGLGNVPQIIIASDADVKVAASSVAFSLFAKAAQVGASVANNGIVPVCATVTASSATISIDGTVHGTPVAAYGYAKPYAYVLTVGQANTVGSQGTAYEVDTANNNAILGFTAVSGTQYKVYYNVAKANAKVAKLSAIFTPGIYHAESRMAVYRKQAGASSANATSPRVGWLYYIIPYLQMSANANIVGDQTTADTTDLSGTALAYDAVVETAVCGAEASTLAYYVYVPDDATESVVGLAVVGGEVSTPVSTTKQIPVKYVMADGTLAQPNYADLTFTAAGAPTGTTVGTTGVITAGTTAGDFDVNVKITAKQTIQATVPCSVTSA